MNPISLFYTFLLTILPIAFCFSSNSFTTKISAQQQRDTALAYCMTKDVNKLTAFIDDSHQKAINRTDKILIYSPQEKILADFLGFRFAIIISEAKAGLNEALGYANYTSDGFKEAYLDATDTLDLALIALAKEQRVSVLKAVNDDSKLSAEEKKFLRIKLEYTTNYGNFCTSDNASLIAFAQEFIIESSDSLLVQHTNDLILKPRQSKFGAGSSLFMGAAMLTGDASSYFSNPAVCGMSLDFSYAHFGFIAQIGTSLAMNSKVSMRDDAGNQTWAQDEKAGMPFINVATGYNISQWQELNIIPLIGFHGSSIKSTEKGTIFQNDTPEAFSSPVRPLFGAAVDYNIPIGHCHDQLLRNTERRMMFVRFHTAYIPSAYKSHFDGDLLFSTIGIGLYTDQQGQ